MEAASRESTPAMDVGSSDGAVVADALVNILLRIPPSARRRLRLVCKHWRDVIDERLPAPRACAKVLLFVSDPRSSGSVSGSRPRARARAYVLDDLRERRVICRELDLQGCGEGFDVSMVGSCNGLICLRRDYGGDLVVVNPETQEKFAIPPATSAPSCRQVHAYSFAFHPETGLYKILHVSAPEAGGDFDAVHVITLGGDASWRETPVPGYSGRHRFGLVSIGGATHWVSRDAQMVVSFDLKDERVAFVKKLPVLVPLILVPTARLADIAGRLGFTISLCYGEATPRIEVWVLEGRCEDRTWIRQYVLVDGLISLSLRTLSPHFVHGEWLLTQMCDTIEKKTVLYAHEPRKYKNLRRCEVVRAMDQKKRTELANFDRYFYSVPTFCHVETTEPVI